jgi:hypothetical protein
MRKLSKLKGWREMALWHAAAGMRRQTRARVM